MSGARRQPGPGPALPSVPGGWPAVLADPPWRFANRTGKAAPEHARLYRYPTMDLAGICGLPVERITAGRARLYLWVPNALVREGLRVMDSWGFRYVTNLVWAKRRIDGGPDGRGTGFYFRNVTELILSGVRGSLRTLPPGRRQASLIETREREHSRKPDETYALIEAWLLIRTEALIRELHCHGADPGSIAGVTEDTRLLATALGDARRRGLRHGPEAAAARGRSHGISGVPAYAHGHAGEEPPYITTAGGRDDLPWAHTATGGRPLMQAFGETEHTTPLNAGHRSQLIQQYSTAYYRARKHSGAAPARTASPSFPADPHQFLPSLDPAALIRQAAPQPAAQPARPGRPLSGLRHHPAHPEERRPRR